MEKLHYREVFWDDFLMDENSGAKVTTHHPRAEDVVFVCDRPWEGCTSGYFQIYRDGSIYRVIYRGSDNPRDTDGHADPNAGFGSIRRGKGRRDPSGRKWGRE